MKQLTEIQQATLDFIRAFTGEHGICPTFTEITDAMGWKSRNTAYLHVKAMEKKGVLKRTGHRCRSIVIAGSGINLPETKNDDYWFEGVFQHRRYERDVVRAIQTAGVSVEGIS